MSARRVKSCGLCGSDDLEVVFSLGSSPPTCVMQVVNGGRPATEEHHPLELLVCQDCTLAQLSVVVDPGVVFPPGYPYQSGNSPALHKNFEELAQQTSEWVGLGPDDLVVDIGANDGTLLSKFDGCRKVGVEPTGQVARIEGPAYRAFFDEDLARRILIEHGPAKVITACNVLAHVEDIGTVMRGIKTLLADDGVLVAENHDLGSVVGGQWDTVYHEHLRFYDLFSFYKVLSTYGLLAEQWQQVATHGGSFRAVASKRRGTPNDPMPRHYNFKALGRDAAKARTNIREATAEGGVYGIGATARATTIINYCGLDVEDVECVCEVAGSDKIGHYIPGTRIPVVDEQRLLEDKPSTVLLFSWHLADSIVPKLRKKGFQGMFMVPLPELHYV
jgi:hypothetical protein